MSYYTPEQYLALERKAEYKNELGLSLAVPNLRLVEALFERHERKSYEYMNGQIFAMSGANRWHNLITVNLLAEIGSQLRGRVCEAYASRMRVKVNSAGMYAYTYPDVVAVCGEPLLEDKYRDTLINPNVIIEVLSVATEANDRGEKFAHYRRLDSLMEYVLVAQDKVLVEHYARHGDTGGQWMLTEISDPDGTLHLASIDCDVALQDIYDRVESSSSDEAATIDLDSNA